MVQAFARLSWQLLEFRLMYYCPDKVHASRHEVLTIPDATYDALEQKYCEMADGLGRPAPIAEMVDFDETRPACRLVMKKLGRPHDPEKK